MKVDLEDCLVTGGILFLEWAAYVIWRPAALILAGLFSFAFAYLIERAKRVKPKN